MRIIIFYTSPDCIKIIGDINRSILLDDTSTFLLFSDLLQLKLSELDIKLMTAQNNYIIETLDSFDIQYPIDCLESSKCVRISRNEEFRLLIVSNKYINIQPNEIALELIDAVKCELKQKKVDLAALEEEFVSILQRSSSG